MKNHAWARKVFQLGDYYGYNDEEMIHSPGQLKGAYKWVCIALALLFISMVWLALDYKLLFGKSWMSDTYDNEDWRTNEGNLHTFGAWDLENHIWKTEYIIKNFPNFNWNPYWYLGMPLLKYYQIGFYFLHWAVVSLTGLDVARASIILIIFSHLLATYLTFLLCYKVSRRILISALCSTFILSSTFISLRSYGWEPITVVFLFLYPLGLLLFLKNPLKPFRFWLIAVLGISYLCHPLLWFSLCMTMGIYLLSIMVRRKHRDEKLAHKHYLFQFFALVFCSILLGAVQFFPQITYKQATSGAHMGVKYLPYYQVPPNIIELKDFFFDAGNLKGPGPIIMIAFFLLIIFSIISYREKRKIASPKLYNHELAAGLTLVLATMVLFYYMEYYNIFPMNILRSIQYHRIIPEFIIAGAVLVASLSNIANTSKKKVMYYTMITAFVLATGIIIYNVQSKWITSDSILSKPEFINDKFVGRISFPYTDQSLAVRNSFTYIPQTYGYYEQGITNPYSDELFSVSSGYHNANVSLIYLKAANIERLYVNTEEGDRDKIVMYRMNNSLNFHSNNNSRYSYFQVPLEDASYAEAVDGKLAAEVQSLQPKCRVFFKEKYCGSYNEEFVSIDKSEIYYLSEYVNLLESFYTADANMIMKDPQHYSIFVKKAKIDTAVVVKMTYDKDFVASIGNKKVKVEPFGPYFMLITPQQSGDYNIDLVYHVSRPIVIGAWVSVMVFIGLAIIFGLKRKIKALKFINFNDGDM